MSKTTLPREVETAIENAVAAAQEIDLEEFDSAHYQLYEALEAAGLETNDVLKTLADAIDAINNAKDALHNDIALENGIEVE